MLFETLTMDFRKARSVNQTSATFVAKTPTNTEPKGDANTATGSSIIELASLSMMVQNGILILPYGVGADDTTFSLRVIGWRRVGNQIQPSGPVPGLLWVPVNLLELACTICTVTGQAGCQVLDTENFVDILTVTTGSSLSGEAASENIVSPANNTIAHALVDMKGCQKLELSFTTGGSATSCNALIAFM